MLSWPQPGVVCMYVSAPAFTLLFGSTVLGALCRTDSSTIPSFLMLG